MLTAFLGKTVANQRTVKQQYDDAIGRAGRIWNIVGLMSRNPRVLKASMELYGALMHAPSTLSRLRREMLAVVVSVRNRCVY